MKDYTKILSDLGLPRLKYIGKEMQCIVFGKAPDEVIKIYGIDIGEENMMRLMEFDNSFDTSSIDFSVPSIADIEKINDKLIVTEKKLPGRSIYIY